MFVFDLRSYIPRSTVRNVKPFIVRVGDQDHVVTFQVKRTPIPQLSSSALNFRLESAIFPLSFSENGPTGSYSSKCYALNRRIVAAMALPTAGQEPQPPDVGKPIMSETLREEAYLSIRWWIPY